jgi:hypothetical protein
MIYENVFKNWGYLLRQTVLFLAKVSLLKDLSARVEKKKGFCKTKMVGVFRQLSRKTTVSHYKRTPTDSSIKLPTS